MTGSMGGRRCFISRPNYSTRPRSFASRASGGARGLLDLKREQSGLKPRPIMSKAEWLATQVPPAPPPAPPKKDWRVLMEIFLI
jgi:hypothetical protein